MEMEGRGFSDLLRNTSEEIFLKTMMENPIGIPAPSMEMLGFRNISQSFRGDSEELFNSWLSNGEISSYGSSAATHRTRQASRRISTELALSQQNEAPFVNLNTIDEHSNDQKPHSQRKEREKEMQASNLYLAKAWFNSSQPMTRSRSSELRRRYAATQSSQLQTLPQAPRNIPAHGATKMQLDFTNTNNFFNVQSNQMHSFMSSSNSSSTFNATPVTAADTVSSVVSMLRGTLQRKKLNNLNEVVPSLNHDQALGNHANLTQVEAHVRPTTEGFSTRANQVHIGAPSQEPSQSGSSTADPTLSNGFEVCDDPAYSGQDFKGNDYRDMMFRSSFNDARKKPNLLRMGSISSAPSDDKADPTKKRRVERSRKMAEAKEKSCTPLVPSNMQSIMKRCANLEKEVRSLKLNLSFMNRKDSEQTKEIEELQKHYAELANEKEWLLGEIERKRMKRSGF